jgi:PTS system galactitol-specific IIA component
MTNKILELLEPSAVRLHTSARDAAQVIGELGGLLEAAGSVRSTFIQAALDRERQLPTGLPLEGKYNAAIPHTDIEHVIRPALALATLTDPVIFQNMIQPEEGVPVQIVFVMALEQPKSQVEMLQEIAGVLQDSQRIELLMQAASFEQVQQALA